MVPLLAYKAGAQRGRVALRQCVQLPKRLERGAEARPLPLAVGDLERDPDPQSSPLVTQAVDPFGTDLGDETATAGPHEGCAEPVAPGYHLRMAVHDRHRPAGCGGDPRSRR